MEAIRICAVCGRVISEDDGWNIVNEGTDKEYITTKAKELAKLIEKKLN